MILVLKSLCRAALFCALPVASLGLVSCSEERSGAVQTVNLNEAGNQEVSLAIRTAQREMRNGNLQEAARLLDEARASEPGNAQIWVAISRLRFRGGEHLSAIEAADKALELAPGHGEALLMRGQLVRDSHGLAESLVWFEAAVEADPENPEVLGEYAATLGDAGRHSDMLSAAEDLSDLDSENTQALYLRAVLAARAGKPVLAKSLLDRSGWRQNGVASALQLDAVIDLEQGNADTAVETLTELIRRQPTNRRVRDLYARALWDAGRDEKLVKDLASVIEGPDANAYVMMLVGRAHERLGNRARAAELISKAYAMQDADWDSLSSRGFLGGNLAGPTTNVRTAIESGNASGAFRQAEGFKRQYPQSADVLALAGDAALANGSLSNAIANYTASAKVRRPWPLTSKLVEALRQAGEEQAANALLSRYTLSDPRNADAILSLVKIAQENEDWDRVSALTQYAIDLGTGQDPSVLQSSLAAANALGKTAQAKQLESLLYAVRPTKLVVE